MNISTAQLRFGLGIRCEVRKDRSCFIRSLTKTVETTALWSQVPVPLMSKFASRLRPGNTVSHRSLVRGSESVMESSLDKGGVTIFPTWAGRLNMIFMELNHTETTSANDSSVLECFVLESSSGLSTEKV